MNNLIYYVRTTGRRVLDDSFSQIEYKTLIDNSHQNAKAFISQLAMIYHSGESCVMMEDDIRLCKDFKNKIEKVIAKHPNDIINFFTSPQKYINCSYGDWRLFSYNQCTYYPKEKIKQILDCYNQLKDKDNKIKEIIEGTSCERLLKYIFKKINLIHYRYRPCLIQHLDYLSIIQSNKNLKRRSIYFVDYLDELNISYEEAESNKNRIKLTKLLKKDFEGD